MKSKTVSTCAAMSVAFASRAGAFLAPPKLAGTGATVAGCRSRASALRMATEEEEPKLSGQVYYASEVTDKKTKLIEELGDIGVATYEETIAEETDRFGPDNYEGLIDGDAFDGGDGQVGCVGDGGSALDSFDNSEVVKKKKSQGRLKVKESLVKESKSRQMNAWGSSTGYAEKLKEEGLSKVDQYGEDRLYARRQQLENWRNQRDLAASQKSKMAELDSMVGGDENKKPTRNKGSGYMDALSGGATITEDTPWNQYEAPDVTTKKDGTSWEEVTVATDEKIEARVPVISSRGYPGSAVLEVRNTVMTFEPFHAAFVGEHNGFSVSPTEGTLNRRGGEPQELSLTFKSKGPGDNRIATLVVETEEDKWVYKIEGGTQ